LGAPGPSPFAGGRQRVTSARPDRPAPRHPGPLDFAARVTKLLLREAEEQGGEQRQGVPVDLGLTQTELAQMVGASQPAVNRVLQTLADRGSISIDGRKIIIQDTIALRRRAGQ
jgi:CRP-like cAMP-binding protein